MAKRLTKALRGKRRWIGLVTTGYQSREEVKEAIKEIAPSSEWKLTVFEDQKAILKVSLKDIEDWRTSLAENHTNLHSVTTSGKIRLVKEKMGLN